MRKVKKESILKWTKALRDGSYKQEFGRLESDGGFCCLGVLCKVSIPKYRLHMTNGVLKGFTPNYNSQPNAPKWVRQVDEYFERVTGSALHALNDSQNYSFNEIADLIELVLIYKALD